MVETRHGYLGTSEGIHIPYQWTYADTDSRLAATGFVATDVGKLARQLDTESLWLLTATTPTWQPVRGALVLDDLADVDLTLPPEDGNVLSYNDEYEIWQPASAALLGSTNVFTEPQYLRYTTDPHLYILDANTSAGSANAYLILGNADGGGAPDEYWQLGFVARDFDINSYKDGSNQGTRLKIKQSGEVLINTVSADGQLVAVAKDTTTVGLVIDTPSTPTANLAELRAGGSAQFAVGPAGQIRTNQTAASGVTTPVLVPNRLPIYDVAGTLIGYVPVYDTL